jgi:hypothetical protein
MTTIEPHGGVEPSEWFLVFSPRSNSWWLSILAGGWVKHVCAFGFVSLDGKRVWVLHDSNWSGVQVVVYSHDGMKAAMARMVADGAHIVKVKPSAEPMAWRSRFGFWCFTAAKHVIRARTFALTGTGLYHHVIRNGGVVIAGAAQNSNRPDAGDRAAAGAE